MKKITIHTDGGCDGNPGPGGWAAVLDYGGRVKEISGGEPATTNNRMELQAAISALEALTEPCEVEFFTDSLYLRNGVSEWLAGWKAKGWMLKSKKAVKNEDLWRRLDTAASRHKVAWKWVRGHAGHPLNERCDELAAAQITAMKKRFSAAEIAKRVEELQAARNTNLGQTELFGE